MTDIELIREAAETLDKKWQRNLARRVRALADRMEKAEPFAWAVPEFGFYFPTKDRAISYQQNIIDKRDPFPLYTHHASDEVEAMKQDITTLYGSLNSEAAERVAAEREVERLKAERDELRRLNKEANKIITMTNSMHICSPDAATYIDDQNWLIAVLEAQLSAIRQVAEIAAPSQSLQYEDCLLIFASDWQAILDAVNTAPAQEPEAS